MSISAIHFEAKKHAYRQTQDGVVVSFVVHPNDLNAAFAVAPLGTRYVLALAEIGDDEQPNPPGGTTDQAASPAESAVTPTPLKTADVLPGGAKERRPFHTLPLPQQVALRCADEGFQSWAFVYAQDQKWSIGNGPNSDCYGTDRDEVAASVIRKACGVISRGEIKPGTEAAKKWLALETQYLADTGQMAEERR